jgi:hypothetical protein
MGARARGGGGGGGGGAEALGGAAAGAREAGPLPRARRARAPCARPPPDRGGPGALPPKGRRPEWEPPIHGPMRQPGGPKEAQASSSPPPPPPHLDVVGERRALGLAELAPVLQQLPLPRGLAAGLELGVGVLCGRGTARGEARWARGGRGARARARARQHGAAARRAARRAARQAGAVTGTTGALAGSQAAARSPRTHSWPRRRRSASWLATRHGRDSRGGCFSPCAAGGRGARAWESVDGPMGGAGRPNGAGAAAGGGAGCERAARTWRADRDPRRRRHPLPSVAAPAAHVAPGRRAPQTPARCPPPHGRGRGPRRPAVRAPLTRRCRRPSQRPTATIPAGSS